ncbi:uncharacterized protein LOC105423709 [Pogonomyrmex barbatus]|uniref:Uncharacterized protein LOC105423709 n=1 Tax=Pogonomyrmex barbatus TaxID=144034 RepID=A0A6I9VUW6_9HYME|nr:uncharacterized protein LOC105423709 [Pogonomyrmex barbatus]
MLFYILSIFSVITFGLSASPTLHLITCKRDSANYSTCLKHALEEAWPRFTKGIPEIGFPTLDPLFYKYVKVSIDTGEIHAEIIFTNVSGSGLAEARFSDIRAHFLDDDVFRLEIDVYVPKLYASGFVKARGTLSSFVLSGGGYYNVTAEDVSGPWDLIGHVVNDTWIVESFRAVPSLQKLKVQSDDLFDGNKELNNLVLTFVNEYWPSLYRVLLPIAVKEWNPWFTSIANTFFSKVSFSELFP